MTAKKDLKSILELGDRVEVYVWTSSDDKGTMFYSHVLKISNDSFVIERPPLHRTFLLRAMTEGVKIGVVAAHTEVIIFYGVIQGRTADNNYLVSFPPDMSYDLVQEKRHLRASFEQDITIELSKPGLLRTTWETFKAKSVNISASGLLFSSNRQLKENDEVKIHFQLDDDLGPFLLEGRVVYSREAALLERVNVLYYTACQFTSITKVQEAQIADVCRQIYFDDKHMKDEMSSKGDTSH